MHLLETTDSAVGVADVLASRLPEDLSETAKKLYITLVSTAVETAKGRGHSPATTSVVLHCPVEQVAKACGISRVSAWRHLPALRELGVIDYKTHKGTLRRRTRNTGTVWRVRLTTERGCKARLSYGDTKHAWRDMDADVKRGRTSYAALKHTYPIDTDGFELERTLAWSLPPKPNNHSLDLVCSKPRRVDLITVLDVPFADRKERNTAVELAAQAMAATLRDADSISFYQRLLWQLLRASDRLGLDCWHVVYEQVRRAAVDDAERFARRPGALLTARLKRFDWWDAVMNAPPVRVGTAPTN